MVGLICAPGREPGRLAPELPNGNYDTLMNMSHLGANSPTNILAIAGEFMDGRPDRSPGADEQLSCRSRRAMFILALVRRPGQLSPDTEHTDDAEVFARPEGHTPGTLELKSPLNLGQNAHAAFLAVFHPMQEEHISLRRSPSGLCKTNCFGTRPLTADRKLFLLTAERVKGETVKTVKDVNQSLLR